MSKTTKLTLSGKMIAIPIEPSPLGVEPVVDETPKVLLREWLEAWRDQFGEDACDCRPEPENLGHVCLVCRTQLYLDQEGN